MSRWAGYDREGAFEAARRYDRGDLNFREVLQGERDARPKGLVKRGPRRLDVIKAWKETCLEKLARAIKQEGLEVYDSDNGLPVDK